MPFQALVGLASHKAMWIGGFFVGLASPLVFAVTGMHDAVSVGGAAILVGATPAIIKALDGLIQTVGIFINRWFDNKDKLRAHKLQLAEDEFRRGQAEKDADLRRELERLAAEDKRIEAEAQVKRHAMKNDINAISLELEEVKLDRDRLKAIVDADHPVIEAAVQSGILPSPENT